MNRVLMRHAMAAGVAAVSLTSGGGHSLAAPLDPSVCASLKTEAEGLEREGVRDLMARGPGGGRIERAQLAKIKQLMDLDGQLRFRCGSDRPGGLLKEEPPEDPAEAAALSAPIERGTPGITLPAEPTVAPVRPMRPAAPAKTAEPADGAAAPKPKPAAKPKPKVDDALRPSPPVDATSGGNQPAGKQ